VANHGKIVFFTGNWYASRSIDGGSTWTYVNPFSVMSSFCCDQDVVYDPHFGVFVWEMMGVPDSSNQNSILLGVSTDASSWWFYSFTPSAVNSAWTGQWFDYPHLALSRDFLYVTSNIFSGPSSTATYAEDIVFQLPLQQMSLGQSFGYQYYSTNTVFAIEPVQGTAGTMYLGTHLSTSSFRIYAWTDNSTTIYNYDESIPAYTQTSQNGVCTAPNGYNPCGFDDDRVKAGWVTSSEIGFAWDVAQGNGFSYPYVDVVTFSPTTFNYQGNPYIYNSNYAWMYPSITENTRGDLGFEVFLAGGGHYPSIQVGMNDQYNGAPPPWYFYWGRTGEALGQSRWGDFMTVRQFNSSGNAWIAAGYTSQAGDSVEPRYYVFGQAGDNPYLKPTTTSVSCSPSPVAASTSTTCTATVAGSSPTGMVAFTTSSSTGTFSPASGQCTLSSGSCSVSYADSVVGTDTVTASYTGDSNNGGSSNTFSLTVTQASTSTSVSCAPSSVAVGSATTCSVSVTGSSPTGTVAWSSSGVGNFNSTSCSLKLGQCAVTYTPSSTAGSPVSITASYSGDSNNVGGTGTFSLTVTPKSTTTSVNCTPTTVTVGLPGTCSASVVGASPSGTISWSSNSTAGTFNSTSCTLSSGSCGVTFRGSAAGKYSIVASYSGDSNNSPSVASTVVLVKGGTGLLRVQGSPAIWTTIWVNGIPRNDWGLNWLPLPAANYSISFTDVSGFRSPSDYNVTFYGIVGGSKLVPIDTPIPVYVNTTTVVTIDFAQEGQLKINTSPATDAVVYVNGSAMDPWGDWVSLVPAKYTVSFQSIAGLQTPQPVTVSVIAGAQTTVTGYYNNGTTSALPSILSHQDVPASSLGSISSNDLWITTAVGFAFALPSGYLFYRKRNVGTKSWRSPIASKLIGVLLLFVLLLSSFTFLVPPSSATSAPPSFTRGKSINGVMSNPFGLAFDHHGNLWVSDNYLNYVVEFSASTLANQEPTILRTITVGSNGPRGLAFDPSGNLWVANHGGDNIVEYSAASLNTTSPVNSKTISCPGLSSSTAPYSNTLTFDSFGDLWVPNCSIGGDISEFNSTSLSSSNPTATKTISYPGDGVAFDSSGDLWVVYGNLYEFNTTSLASSNPAPTRQISYGGSSFAGLALSFDQTGNLWIARYGCCGNDVVGYNSSTLASQNPQVSVTITNGIDGPVNLAIDSLGNLWVLNFYLADVAEFGVSSLSHVNPAPDHLVTSILDDPQGLTFDPSGGLWVTNWSSGFAVGFNSSSLSKTLPTVSAEASNGQQTTSGVAFDSSDNMWVASFYTGALIEFNASSLSHGIAAPHRTITGVLPYDLAFDRYGNLWMSDVLYNLNRVVEISNTSLATASPTISKTFTTGLDRPDGLAFDSSGDLWVSNLWGNTLVKYTPAELGVNNSSPQMTISTGLNGPSGLAFDPSGDLWVSNTNGGNVVEYNASALASTTPNVSYTIPSLNQPVGIGFDPSGNLWVSISAQDAVQEFIPSGGSNTPGSGLLRVQGSPAVWTTVSVNGIPRNDWGLNWLPLATGNYSVGFTGVPGFRSPANYNVSFFGQVSGSKLFPISSSIPVYANTTTVVTISFIQEGLLKINTSPPTDAVVYVNGSAMDPWGDWVSLPPAKYTVSFQPINGLATPQTETVNVVAGAQTTVTGYYNNGTTSVASFGLASQHPSSVTIQSTNSQASPWQVLSPVALVAVATNLYPRRPRNVV
jgi:sugar lactone lactonase YvrE